MCLTDILVDRIAHNGPITFHDFMESCLYHPGFGYYMSTHPRIGTSGDFHTSTSYPLFGGLIAKQLEEIWIKTGMKKFNVIEYGAGNGQLCNSILQHLKTNPPLYKAVAYRIIEKSPSMRKLQRQIDSDKISWHSSLREIDFNDPCCILSNELIDNFAVHQVVMQEQLMEVYIDYKNHFEEILKPASAELINYFDELNVSLPYGFRTEINLEALSWMREIAQSIRNGFIITIDYGFDSTELYSTKRRNGTILCYKKHTINDCPYDNIGEQDITSHINFSALVHWGQKYGLTICGYTDQRNFLLNLGFNELCVAMLNECRDYQSYRKFAQLKYSLLMDIGTRIKVLIQSKGVTDNNLLCLTNGNLRVNTQMEMSPALCANLRYPVMGAMPSSHQYK